MEKEDQKDPRVILAGLIVIVWVLGLIGFFIWAWAFNGASHFIPHVIGVAFAGSSVASERFTLEAVKESLLSFLGAEMLVGFLMAAAILVLTRRPTTLHPTLHRPSVSVSLLGFSFNLLGAALREEVVFRWLPLVAIAAILPDTVSVTTSLILGSSVIFALEHLRNFDPEDRHWIMVVSHFVSGLFFVYAFLRWGFAGAVFVHYFHNFFVMIGSVAAFRAYPKALSFLELRKP